MNEQQNPYNQQPQWQTPMMPPMHHHKQLHGQWKQRVMNRQEGVNIISQPKWLTQYSIIVYLLALGSISVMYSSYSLPWYYVLAGIVAVTVFFLYGSSLVDNTSIAKLRNWKSFERRIFIIAFILRLIWTILIYYVYMQSYGDSFGFENSDATFYDELGKEFASAISQGDFLGKWTSEQSYVDVSDMGYASYMGLVYWMTGNSIIALRLLKCIWSTLTVLLIYRLTKRNFGEQTGRIAAIFCALWPNFWYYCGGHLKETEMVFLGVLFVEQADQMLRSRQFTAWKVIPVLLLGAAILTFRTPLALVAFLSLIFSVVMTSSRVVSWGKRIIVGFLAVLLIGVTMGNQLQEQAEGLIQTAQSDEQEKTNEWRMRRDNGNAFAKYAGKSVFAPLIFTIPFPSMTRPYDGQDVQQLLNGGNFIKNILSSFTIFAMFMLLMSGKWRDHLLPLSFMLGYLVVLTMSTFAQAERFHQPVVPFEFMFAAYGLSIAVTKPKYKRWFMYWCALMFIACIVWNWFKMAGRGLS